MSTTVRLGNPKPINHATGAPVPGERVTEAFIPDGFTLVQALAAITHLGDSTHGVWAAHSVADAPSWVWSDDKALEAALANHYGCPAGEPTVDDPQEG